MEPKTQPPHGEAPHIEAPSRPLPLVVVARETATPPSPGSPWKWRLRVGIPAVLLIAAGAWFGSRPATPPTPAPRMPDGNVVTQAAGGTVMGLGKLLPRGRILTIAPPFGVGDARIAELRAREGDKVSAGAVLATLDSAASLDSALQVAEASVAAKQAALAQTLLVVNTSRDDARAALVRAEASIRTTKRDYDRAVVLSIRADVAEQTLDQRRLTHEQALQDVARAKASLARYDAPDPLRQVDVALAHANLLSALADRDRARADVEKSVIRAPSDGSVLTLYARPGEKAGSQGLMTFGDLSDMIAEIEVYENEAGRLTPGMPASLTAEALPRPLTGTISRIGAEVLRQTLTDASPAANTDTRVLRVTVDLDPASAALASRMSNLQVTARFVASQRP